MNRRGSIIGFVFLMVFLIIMWVIFLSTYFSLAGTQAVANGAVGLEAFLWSNINLWFFLCLLVVFLIYLKLSGGQQ